ncbi:hypothetical protein TNCV_5043001 [Trichonephila clavipes]|nr:hypothetical protein TNCV_5043001 [Trichonephila clavipes]
MCKVLFTFPGKELDHIQCDLRSQRLHRTCSAHFLRPYALCHKNSAGLSIGHLWRAPRGPDELDLTRFSGHKFRSTSDKVACRSAARDRN